MINYKLAKKLKEAGLEAKEYICDNLKFHKTNSGICERCEPKYTLSELIEACGNEFHELHHCHRGFKDSETFLWYVWGHNRELGEFIGKTPEEAVAKLLTKLNEKKKKTLNKKLPLTDSTNLKV